jgi:hypothetical protein
MGLGYTDWRTYAFIRSLDILYHRRSTGEFSHHRVCPYSLIAANQQSFKIIPTVSPQLLPGCLFRSSSTLWRPILFPFLYETFVIALTLVKVMSMPTRVPVVMRLFMDGTLYYIVVATVLLATTIGAAYAPVRFHYEQILIHLTVPQTRLLFIGSGFHTACISVGCSRLVLSLHSWAHESKRRSVARFSQTRADINKRQSSDPSFSSSSTGSASIHPAYELVPRAAPDVEVGKVAIGIVSTSNTSVTPLSFPQEDAPDARSMLPDIERPSLPTRMCSNNSSMHTRESQRSHRPPRSSSLYPVGYIAQENRLVLPSAQSTDILEERQRGNRGYVEGRRSGPFGGQRTYNVI